jgi:RNA polymerase sigma factor (sigma-70 family)
MNTTAIPNKRGPSAGTDYFATTHWTVIARAGEDSPQAPPALDELCRVYWYPLYAFVRHQGARHPEAEDLVQGFFANFLRKNHLASLRKENGRFRAFLLACLKNHLANERDRSLRKKRGAGLEYLQLDWVHADERYNAELAQVDASPDRLFDRAWASTLLEHVLTRLQQAEEENGNLELFKTLRPCLMVNERNVSYGEWAAKLGMKVGAVRVAAHRLRRRYQELLRAEIASTCDPAYLKDEIQALLLAYEA